MTDDIVYIQRRRVEAILEHPDADRLAVVKLGKFTVVHSKEDLLKHEIKLGSRVLHVPTDICIHPDKAAELGVDTYCRKCHYKEMGKHPCRVVAARLRGVASYGFLILDDPLDKALDGSYDEYYGVWRYEPPEIPPGIGGDKEREEHPQFPKYTKIRRIQYQVSDWTEGIPVRVTEKLHGTNCRLGVVQVDGEWRYMVGSHNVILREYVDTDKGPKRNRYWEMLDERVMDLLNELCDGEHSVIVFGEMLGPGIQDLDYGLPKPELRVFDIMVDGEYLDWDLVRAFCEKHMILTVPLLFEGSFTWCLPEQFVDGQTTVTTADKIKSRFKGREGVVITPLQETQSPRGGRLIAKVVSADYESRRGGTEYH